MEDRKNKVELIGIYGDDLLHGLSAWTSTSRELSDEKRERLPKLINMLGNEGHHTPFEKSMIHFLVTTDIATHIHLLKHRIGVSINGESARYKELKDDKFYVPQDWDTEEQTRYINFMENALNQYHETLNRLVAKGVSRKRAKESARFYLPYGNQITADISFNFRSFMHFQGLRNSEHAQVEIRELAKEMLRFVQESNKFDLSLKAFGYAA
jgi:flavin-dependent thymidylate synthase